MQPSIKSKLIKTPLSQFKDYLNKHKEFPFTNKKCKMNIYNKTWINNDTFICDSKIYSDKVNSSDKNDTNSANNTNNTNILSLLEYYVPPCLHYSVFSEIKIGNTLLNKRYTPLKYSDYNTFKALYRIYKDENNQPFGRMGKHIESKRDSEFDIEFPYGNTVYLSNGEFLTKPIVDKLPISKMQNWDYNKYKKVCLISGGTGITPLFRILQEAKDNFDQETEYYIIHAQTHVDGLYLYEEMRELQKSIKLKIKFIIDKDTQDNIDAFKNKNKDVNIERSFSKDVIKEFFPSSCNETLVLSCGNKIMLKGFLKPMVEELGYKFSIV